jgi:hypothetical protein
LPHANADLIDYVGGKIPQGSLLPPEYLSYPHSLPCASARGHPVPYRRLLEEFSRKLKRHISTSEDRFMPAQLRVAGQRARTAQRPGVFRLSRPGGHIVPSVLLPTYRSGGHGTGHPGARTRLFEKNEIQTLLQKNGSHLAGKKKTAAELGISLASLYNKLNADGSKQLETGSKTLE